MQCIGKCVIFHLFRLLSFILEFDQSNKGINAPYNIVGIILAHTLDFHRLQYVNWIELPLEFRPLDQKRSSVVDDEQVYPHTNSTQLYTLHKW